MTESDYMKEARRLVAAFGIAAFRCGNWRREISLDAYEVRSDTRAEAESALLSHIAKGEQAPGVLTDERIAEIAERMEASDPAAAYWREFARAVEQEVKGEQAPAGGDELIDAIHKLHYAAYSWGFEAGKVGQHVDTTIAGNKADAALKVVLALAAAPLAGEGDAQDAARYRFLRDAAHADSNGGLRCVGNCADGGAPLPIGGRDLDRAIDATMKAHP